MRTTDLAYLAGIIDADGDGEFLHIVGNFSGVPLAREVMGMPWASREGLREAVPPAYTEHIGRALIKQLTAGEVAA
jgi:DNA (cytosine-5)-methyltransferase 1